MRIRPIREVVESVLGSTKVNTIASIEGDRTIESLKPLEWYQLPESNPNASKFNKLHVLRHPGTQGLPFFLGYDLESTMQSELQLLAGMTEGLRATVVLGPSGCGKTKLMLKFLSQRRGNYFCADGKYSSRDIKAIGLKLATIFEEEEYAGGDAADDAVFHKNAWKRLRVAHEAIRALLLARQFVYEHWKHIFKTPEDWLWVQLFPTFYFCERDVFQDLSMALLTEADVYELGREKIEPVPQVFDEAQVMFAIGESQQTGLGVFLAPSMEIMSDAVSTPFERLAMREEMKANGGYRRRSIRRGRRTFLDELVRYLDTTVPAIYAGTSVRLLSMQRSLTSSYFTIEGVDRFFLNFIPFSLEAVKATLVKFLNVPVGNELDHACRWLVGRPRFTLEFIQSYMHENLTSVDGFKKNFAIYVKRMTEYASGSAYSAYAIADKVRYSSIARNENLEAVRSHNPAIAQVLFGFCLSGEEQIFDSRLSMVRTTR